MSTEPPLVPGDPRLQGWYHTIELGPGVVTEGIYDHRPVLDRFRLPDDLHGKRALDVGTASGFFAFELERRGAYVAALEIDDPHATDWAPTAPHLSRAPGWNRECFRLAQSALGTSVEHRMGNVYDLGVAGSGLFDVVMCGSLLLHLMHPMRALLALRSVTRELLILETAADPGLEARCPGEPVLRFGSRHIEESEGLEIGAKKTYWWVTGPALAEMLAHAGFRDVEVLPAFELPPTGHPVVVAHARP